MSRHLKKAASLLNIIGRSNYADCVNFLENLDNNGIELICKLIFFIVSGELTLNSTAHARLKQKIKKDISNIKKLFLVPRHSKDIREKRKILQRKKIIGILTAVAKEAIPNINTILAKHK